MPAAARIGDATSHVPVGSVNPTGVPIAPTGVLTVPVVPDPRTLGVLICGKPAAVAASVHACTLHAPLGPANLVLPVPTPLRMVLIGGQLALAAGDPTTCGARVAAGAPTVFIGGVV